MTEENNPESLDQQDIIQKIILEIVQKYDDTILPDDNIFEKINSSIKLMEIFSELKNELAQASISLTKDLDITDLFEYNSIAQLAEHISTLTA